MNTKSRKTIEVESLLDYANGFLSAKFGSQEERRAIILMIEFALMKANRYRGFRYLDENELSSFDKPGIRWVDYDPYTMPVDPRFVDTDPTRVRYA